MNLSMPRGLFGGGANNGKQQKQQQQQQQRSNDGAVVAADSQTQALLREREAQIVALQEEVSSLQNKLSTLTSQYSLGTAAAVKRRRHGLLPYNTLVRETSGGSVGSASSASGRARSGGGGGGGKSRTPKTIRARMGRNASVSTAKVLSSLPDNDDGVSPQTRELAQRVVDMFKDPASHVSYLNSENFARDFLRLCSRVKPILEAEPKVAFLQSPAYVFGDIHGNLEDLHFFSDNVWRLGMALTAGNFVFLGDYVDRGMSCLEVVSYLFAMKILLPHKVFLLRGNHETRDVNGWEEHYGKRSFIWQCRERFGDDIGFRIWEHANQAFDRMPLSAVIDHDIFCVHGGIPRPIQPDDDDDDEDEDEDMDHTQHTSNLSPAAAASPTLTPAAAAGRGAGGGGPRSRLPPSRVQSILRVPKVAGINPPYQHESESYQQVASDCIWSDPASDEQERHGVDPNTGFGESLRGGGAICFGHRAVTDFLQQHGLSYIMRAHEAHAEGVAVSKGARVFTVFSTSKDHNQGSQALAGCILVDSEKLQVINRSPAYRNQYVHRRDSVSVAMLSPSEVNARIRLGLIRGDSVGGIPHGQYGEEDDDEDEDWEDFEEDDNDEEQGGVGGMASNLGNPQLAVGGVGNAAVEQETEEDDDDDDDDDDDNENGQEAQGRGGGGEGGGNNDDDDDDDDDDEDDQYVLATRRRSSVDPSRTVASTTSSTGDWQTLAGAAARSVPVSDAAAAVWAAGGPVGTEEAKKGNGDGDDDDEDDEDEEEDGDNAGAEDGKKRMDVATTSPGRKKMRDVPRFSAINEGDEGAADEVDADGDRRMEDS